MQIDKPLTKIQQYLRFNFLIDKLRRATGSRKWFSKNSGMPKGTIPSPK